MIFNFKRFNALFNGLVILIMCVLVLKMGTDIVKPAYCAVFSCKPTVEEEKHRREKAEEANKSNEVVHDEQMKNKDDNKETVYDKVVYDREVDKKVNDIIDEARRKYAKQTIQGPLVEPVKLHTPQVSQTLSVQKSSVKPVSVATVKPVFKEDKVARQMAEDLWSLYLFEDKEA